MNTNGTKATEEIKRETAHSAPHSTDTARQNAPTRPMTKDPHHPTGRPLHSGADSHPTRTAQATHHASIPPSAAAHNGARPSAPHPTQGTARPPHGDKKQNRLTPSKFILYLAGVLLLVLISVTVFSLCCLRSVTVEVGDVPNYSHITGNGFVSLFCKLDTDVSETDTSSPADIKIPLRLFGFIKGKSTLHIVDTVPPEIVPTDVCITLETPLTGDMFARGVTDRTKVTFKITTDVDVSALPKDFDVTVLATDEGGNTVEFNGKLTVVDQMDALTFEYGVTEEQIRSAVLSVLPELDNMDLSDIGECGSFTVRGRNGNVGYFALVTVKDTKPPVADISSYDAVIGQPISDEETVKNIVDHSEVTVSIINRADFNTCGEYSQQITLTDSSGNSSFYISYIRVHDISTEITCEIQSSNEELAALIFNDDWSRENLKFENDSVLDGIGLGEHEVILLGKYNTVPVKVTVIDTTPPELVLKEQSFPVGKAPSPADFVASCHDATKVKYSFNSTPDHSKAGTFDVTVTAADTSQNKTEKTTRVTFFHDTDPPVISGCGSISFRAGRSCDYMSGVSAYDSVWGPAKVTVDYSGVDSDTPGTYYVTYSATDGSGNTATETVTVTVTEPLRVCLNVTNLMQKPSLPNGCEVVSLGIALRYNGFSVDPVTLYDNFMPKSPYKNGDPWTTYVGDAKGRGYGCYAPCVVETGNAYLDSVGSPMRVTDVSGNSMSYYESLIDRGIPVILWCTVGMNRNPKICWEATVNGKNVNWHSSSHCMVLIGYTDDNYIFCDPLNGIKEYSKSSTETSFAINYRQACIVS